MSIFAASFDFIGIKSIKMKFIVLSLCITLLTFSVFAQKKNEQYQLIINKATSAIKIDGVMDEKAWSETAVAKDFNMVLPMDSSLSNVKTTVRMAYDENNMYIIAECFKGMEGADMIESLRRDWNFGKNDNFIAFIDPFNDQTNGFAFGTNAVGAQWDGIMFDGGRMDLSWDNKWTSVVKMYADKWVFEAAIPFKTIRYKKGNTKWGINFSRNDLKTTEKSAWAPVPRQFPSSSMAYSGNLVWNEPPPSQGMNISAIPYVLGGLTKNFEQKKDAVLKKDFGGDAKFAITSSLNLDVTLNPDFSQVEVDRQQTNFDRFELFFPERRQFFLENGDLFSNFGYNGLRPFFSRRIGLNVPIQFGARLSGRINENWRLGLMNMQTDNIAETSQPKQNFSVFALQRKVFSRSNVGLLVVNKESLFRQPNDSIAESKYASFNRNVGFEYNLASSNNLWTGKTFFMKSFSPKSSNRDIAHGANIQYSSKYWNLGWQHEYVGADYNAEVGFVQRRGYVKLNPQISRLFFPKSGPVLSHAINFGTNHFFTESMRKLEDETYLAYNAGFRNRATATLWIARNYIELPIRVDPTNFTKDTLEKGSKHEWYAFGTEFVSKPQSVFSYSFSSRYGGYYANGKRLNLTTELGYRFQPYVNLAVSASYNNIQMPEPLKDAQFWLIGPRVDLTMTDKLFFTAFTQYNGQQKNMNLNTRLQWRYQPASDLFLVYTDNYLPSPFNVKNRSLVLKFTYWWNI
jgi:Domain of unknown function (DUF5916)/Carbohydrate family 9 binding domain-like